MKNPLHNYQVWEYTFISILFLDILFTFMGVYNYGMDHEENPHLKEAILNQNLFFPFIYISLVISALITCKRMWKYTFSHYIYWTFVILYSLSSWVGWLTFFLL